MLHKGWVLVPAVLGVGVLSSCSRPMAAERVDLLANGMEGWEVVNGPAESWAFKNGVLYTDGNIEKYGSWISTVKKYSDFRLELEFKVSEGGNSGVFVRAPRSGDGAYLGMEVQILDDYSAKLKDLKPWQFTGSIYDVVAPSKRVSKKAGRWQKMVIVCDGARCSIKLNEEEIVDVNLDEVEGKTKRHLGLKRRTGYIGFQNHKDAIEFRNIFLIDN